MGGCAVTAELLALAQAGDEHAFGQLVDPYRRELQVYCYRFLGSVPTPRTRCKTPCYRPGSTWPGSRDAPRSGPGCTGSPRAGAWTRFARLPAPPVTAPPAGLEPPEPTRLGELLWLEPYPDELLAGLADSAPGPTPGMSPGNRSRSPSSPPCSCCRLAGGPPHLARCPGVPCQRGGPDPGHQRGIGDQRAQARPRERSSAASDRRGAGKAPPPGSAAEQQLVERFPERSRQPTWAASSPCSPRTSG